MEEMIICPACNTDLPMGTTQCYNCGTVVGTSAPERQEVKNTEDAPINPEHADDMGSSLGEEE